MSLTVKDALSLEYLEEFKLIAGQGGLKRIVNTVGIIDHEIITDMMNIFVEGELVLATLSVARDDVNIVYEAINSLNESKAAGLAFKTVYYETLPDYILDYANENDFPIFTFDPAIFIENIIRTVFTSIKSKGIHSVREMKLETLFSGDLMTGTVRDIVHELHEETYDYHRVIYMKHKHYMSDDDLIHLIEKFDRYNNRSGLYLYKFRNGLMFLQSYREEMTSLDIDFNWFIEIVGIDIDMYLLGIGDIHEAVTELPNSLREAYHAFQSGSIGKVSRTHYAEIGIQKLLLAIADSPWVDDYALNLINPILDYDNKYQSKLYETIKLYFELSCKTQEVAQILFQHKNTVLYRLNKIKELLGPFKSDQDFHEQLSIAIKLYENKKYK